MVQAQTSFTNAATISVPNGTQLSPQPASTYPSTLSVTGLSGTISKVTVRLNNISTPLLDPNGINALLVGPSGGKLVFLAHPGDGSVTFTGASLVFDDTGPTVPGCNISTCTNFSSGTGVQTYKSTAWTPPAVPTFPAPAPSSPGLPQPAGSATLASTFNGSNPTGTWSLYIVSDASVGTPNATIGGWSLTITTAAGTVPTTTSISSSLNPSYTTAPSNSVTYTATVRTNGTPINVGTVTFSEGATMLSGALTVNGSGQATFATNFTTEGAHAITATYNGTASFGASSSNLTQTVISHTTNPVAGQYCNPGPLTIPQSGLTGTPSGDPANPYPSSIFVTGLSGTISKVTVTLNSLSHPHPNDIAMLLVTPNGAAYVPWSLVASGPPGGGVPATIVLDDAAASQLPATGGAVPAGTYRPAAFNTTIGPIFPAPAPAGFSSAAPYGTITFAQAFNGLAPNGTWNLYVVDDQGGNVGSVSGGWCLTITTANDKPSTTAVAASANPAFRASTVTFTATVKDANTLAPITSGTVTYFDGPTALGAAVAVNGIGQASFTISSLNEGDHLIKAAYNGSPGNYNVSYGTLTQRIDNVTIIAGNQLCNTGVVAINATGPTAGQSYPYPSHIFATNSGGPITKASLILNGLAHDFPSQCQMLLVGPDGTKFEFLGHEMGNNPISGVTMTLDDAAGSLVPGSTLGAGSYTFKPTSANSSDTFLAPAPAGPYNPAAPGGVGTFAALINGKSANGTWSLYINTLTFGGNGSVAGGWCMALNTIPVLTGSPQPQTVCSGTTATFTASAAGLPAPTAQWQVNGGTGFTNLPGATSTTLTFVASVSQNGFQYRAVLTNTSGSVTSSVAALTVNASPAIPAITPNPASLCPNSVGNQASGPGGATSYAWTIANGIITSATNVQTISFTAGASGSVMLGLTVFNAIGCSTANLTNVPITVPPPPTIIPSPLTVCAGSSGNHASGPGVQSSYAWTISNGTINGPTNGPTVTYTAGGVGNVTLGLTVVNAAGCVASGATNVPVSAVPPPVINAPPSVCADSPGNQASGPAGMAVYAWTILDGTIAGPANQQTISFVAGFSGNVTLGLTVVNAGGCSANNLTNVPILAPPVTLAGCSIRTNYFSSLNFTDATISVAMTMAFDGSSYWACSGNTTTGIRLARYDANGVLLGTFSPGLDFRSVFTDGSCAVLARAYNDPTIYRQTSPGVFTSSGVILTGGSLDAQSSVVLNGRATEYLAMFGGVVSRWDTAGNYLGSVNLQTFGTVGGEAQTPQNRGIAAVGDYWLTYNGTNVLSVWDTSGNRLAKSFLAGAGTNFYSPYSLSYCNGKAFVVDVSGGPWRAYDVCSGGRSAIFGAPSSAVWNTDVQNKIQGTGLIPQVDAYLVSGTNPVPALSDLQRYQSVLVYSDSGFSSSTNLGNALADYLDAGGGVSMATFVFSGSAGYAIQGRVANGTYLPFTTAGSAVKGTNLTLVKDLPAHPLLDGVNSFNGGSSSYLDTGLSLIGAPASVLVGHWSNGQPLIGARDRAAVRSVGLNFYPPSNAARNDFWQTNTDGARLLANSLLWSAKSPPSIITGPANQAAGFGATVMFTVAAVGNNPLTYQWRKDGTNILNATNSFLSVLVQTNTLGRYSVVVSNAYGVALSSTAALNPLLRFLPPALQAGGVLPLFLGNVDNSPVTAERAARVRVYATTDLALVLSNWTQLANLPLLTNGLLRVDGIGATNTSTFFRAGESP